MVVVRRCCAFLNPSAVLEILLPQENDRHRTFTLGTKAPCKVAEQESTDGIIGFQTNRCMFKAILQEHSV